MVACGICGWYEGAGRSRSTVGRCAFCLDGDGSPSVLRVAACWLTYCRVCIEYRKRRIIQTSGGTRSGPRRRSASAMNPTNTRKPITTFPVKDSGRNKQSTASNAPVPRMPRSRSLNMTLLKRWFGLEVLQHLTQLRQKEEGEQHNDDQTDHTDDRH